MDDKRTPSNKYAFPNDEMIHEEEKRSEKFQPQKEDAAFLKEMKKDNKKDK